LYSVENLTLREVDKKYLGNVEMWCWGRMVFISWTHRLKSEKYRVGDKRSNLHTIINGGMEKIA
jgi:hypothetical protein